VLLDLIVTVTSLRCDCTYVLMAMWFACFYTIQEQLAPGRSRFRRQPDPSPLWDLLYFSFMVSPAPASWTSTFGRGAAGLIIEQVAGVMYVAILIARLTDEPEPERTAPTCLAPSPARTSDPFFRGRRRPAPANRKRAYSEEWGAARLCDA
jgi:hypothetical protein